MEANWINCLFLERVLACQQIMEYFRVGGNCGNFLINVVWLNLLEDNDGSQTSS